MPVCGLEELRQRLARAHSQVRAAEEEMADIARQPEVERAELVAYYQEKGLDADLASEVADRLMARGALDAKLESEHGILQVKSRAAVLQAGVGSAIAYALGALIPLTITLLVPVKDEPWTILIAALLSLTVTSFIGARAGHMDLRRTMMRALVVGLWTMGASYLFGRVIF